MDSFKVKEDCTCTWMRLLYQQSHSGGLQQNVWPKNKATTARSSKSLVRFHLVSLEFFIDVKSFRSHYGLGVDSASNINEYQEHFLGVKAAGA